LLQSVAQNRAYDRRIVRLERFCGEPVADGLRRTEDFAFAVNSVNCEYTYETSINKVALNVYLVIVAAMSSY